MTGVAEAPLATSLTLILSLLSPEKEPHFPLVIYFSIA